MSLERSAILDHTELSGGATHVKRQQISVTGKHTGLSRRQRACRRAGFKQPHRKT
jgi:hypothetical protein